MLDVIGWRLDDVVDLIRGDKGTLVRLNIIPATAANDMQTKVISITRDKVKLEEQSAKKDIIEISQNGRQYKIGIIDLATFYIDFEAAMGGDKNYKSTTRDVKKLLEELIDEKVDGIVVDLRRNGGGSLSEANSLVGLFIRRGPTVQIRDANGDNYVQGDSDPSVTYSGPLAVLVNRLSASASEIFAGAIQDYQRGLVLGGQTFGKGTVQELVPLRDGQIKITRAKFYRISGRSTQHKGVTPDIIFPDLFEVLDDVGESSLPTALSWDTIKPESHSLYIPLTPLMKELRAKHQNRTANNPDFKYIQEQIARTRLYKEKNTLSLNEDALRKERDENDQWKLDSENRRRIAKNLSPLASLDDIEESDDEEGVPEGDKPADSKHPDTSELADSTTENSDDEDDPILLESGYILLDLINLIKRAVAYN